MICIMRLIPSLYDWTDGMTISLLRFFGVLEIDRFF
jgi:hypothetical protein